MVRGVMAALVPLWPIQMALADRHWTDGLMDVGRKRQQDWHDTCREWTLKHGLGSDYNGQASQHRLPLLVSPAAASGLIPCALEGA